MECDAGAFAWTWCLCRGRDCHQFVEHSRRALLGRVRRCRAQGAAVAQVDAHAARLSAKQDEPPGPPRRAERDRDGQETHPRCPRGGLRARLPRDGTERSPTGDYRRSCSGSGGWRDRPRAGRTSHPRHPALAESSTGRIDPAVEFSSSQLEVVVDDQRRVVREALVEVDLLVPRLRGDARRRQVIVAGTENLHVRSARPSCNESRQ